MIFNASHQIDAFGAGFTLQILRRITGVESGVESGVEVVGVLSHGPRVPSNAGWLERPVALVAMCSPGTVLRTLDVELGLPASEDYDQRRTREGYQAPLIHDVD